MTDYMKPGVLSDLLRTVLTTIIDRPAFFILGVVYQVFFTVAEAELFSNALIRSFYYRCQMVIGVFMLFKFSVTILEGIVDPNRVTDKKNGAGKIISRIVVSLVILALITPLNIPNPSNKWEEELNNNGIIFGALYSLQNRILENNTIGKLVLGTQDDKKTTNKSNTDSANEFSSAILKGFIRYNIVPEEKRKTPDFEKGENYEDISQNLVCDTDPKGNSDVATLYREGNPQEIISLVNLECSQTNGKNLFSSASSAFKKLTGTGNYIFAYSPIGGIVAYIIAIVLILYTVDVAIRAIKLSILRLIAPIPIISHMSISAKESKGADSFSTWINSLTTTYLELFIRLAILYFVIFLINDMMGNSIEIKMGGGIIGAVAFIFIIIGLFFFARQAPKFIQDALGVKASPGIGVTLAAAGLGTLTGGGDRTNVLDNMRSAARAAQNGGKDPGEGQFKTYRDNQVKKTQDKASNMMRDEFYKRGLDIDNQDEAGAPNHRWYSKEKKFLGFKYGADVAGAQTTLNGVKNNQARYQANWQTHERATGRGTTVRGGSEFHTRADAYPVSTPAGKEGTPPSGPPINRDRINEVERELARPDLTKEERIAYENEHARLHNGIGHDGKGGTGYSRAQPTNQSNNNN